MLPVASLSSSITQFVGDYGLQAIFLLMMIDAVFPAASELVMVVGGALAAGAFAGQDVAIGGTGLDAYLAVAVTGTLGYLVGSWIGWGIGLWGGRPLIERHGRWFHLDTEKLDRAERWFERWASWAVFLGRITPVIRSFISIPAGLFEVRFVRYTVLTLLGSAIWSFLFAGIGYAFGANYEHFHAAFKYVDYLVAAAVVGLVVVVFVRRRRLH